MTVTPQLVKELRDRTSAGMMDCKKALEACDCNIEKAIDWLREKGMAKQAKKVGRTAAEGMCNFVIEGNKVVTYELNSETDFAAKNQKFLDLVEKVGNILIKSDVKSDAEALALDVNGESLETVILKDSATIGEKISLRRVSISTKADNEVFGAYKHMGGKIVAVAILAKATEEVAKDVAMHIAASNPEFVSRNDVSADRVQKETQIILTEALNENANAAKPKPQQIIETKIVPGRVDKYFKELCLLDQQFVKNPDETVSVFLSHTQSSVKSFVRLEVGEGIQKEEVDFAAEVAAQAGLN